METEAQHTERGSTPDDGAEPRFVLSSGTWRRTGIAAPALLVLMLLVSAFVAQPFLIPSGSMEPAMKDGDRVLVNKVAYRFGSGPERGDAVVFDGAGSFVPEGTSGADYVKRVVGVGGDRVVCCGEDGRISVNGHRLDETQLKPGDAPSRVAFDIVVPDGRLFVLGDHRSSSRDSRDHLGEPGGGMVPVGQVVGRADWIVWPAGRWTTLERPPAYAAVPDADPGGPRG